MRTKLVLIAIVLAGVSVNSCKKDLDEDIKHTTTPYALQIPAGFPPMVIPADNPLTVEGVELGHHLFFDPILSSNGLSCSSCHHVDKAYSTPYHINPAGDTVSVMSLVNIGFRRNFSWTGRHHTSEDVCIEDFEPEFFNTNMDTLRYRLAASPKYRNMFNRAFGVNDFKNWSDIDLKTKIVKAIGQYLRTLISADSRFDRYLRHEIMLSPTELNGMALFYTEDGDCFHCHELPLMTGQMVTNTGMDSIPAGYDQGLFNFTGLQTDIGRFVTPTLRNIELTAPYMHDGRFKTLDEVIEFYNSGFHQSSPNIDPVMLKPGKEFGLMLTPYERQCLVDFLKTFTDTGFINNPAYQNPL
jgi:cytochrome c peroxidase